MGTTIPLILLPSGLVDHWANKFIIAEWSYKSGAPPRLNRLWFGKTFEDNAVEIQHKILFVDLTGKIFTLISANLIMIGNKEVTQIRLPDYRIRDKERKERD